MNQLVSTEWLDENKDNVKSYNIRLIEDEDGIRKETASI